jgi:two-component system, cell cycle sensor histidine kinase and response regulator CckA
MKATCLEACPRHAGEEGFIDEHAATFRQLADSIDRVLYLVDAHTGHLLLLTPPFERIWGRSRETMADADSAWLETVHPEDRARVGRMMRAKMSGSFDEQYQIVRPDGTVRWVRDRAFPVADPDGYVTRIAGVVEDVTELHAMEARLRQVHKMESMGQLTGGIAHDFNNILTVICGNGEIALERLEEDHPARVALDEIREAAQRATMLTRQLLSFSRRQVTQPTVLDVNTLISETETMLRRLIGEDVRLVTRLAPDLGHIKADPGNLVQVLMNLAVNARDAMPKGGHLYIRTAEIDLRRSADRPRASNSDRFIRISVTDTGCGMPAEVRARIFEPFFTTKETGRGTGLGLAVVHGIVMENGGHIEVESVPNAGTSFHIDLPVCDEGLAAVVAGAVPCVAGGSETILYVEDDPGMRKFTTRALEGRGYRVIVAQDGQHAIELVQDTGVTIDLLLTDVVMPKINGAEVAEKLRNMFPGIRVVFTSGYAAGAVRRYGLPLGEAGFLPKPYTRADLLAVLRESLDGPENHAAAS